MQRYQKIIVYFSSENKMQQAESARESAESKNVEYKKPTTDFELLPKNKSPKKRLKTTEKKENHKSRQKVLLPPNL